MNIWPRSEASSANVKFEELTIVKELFVQTRLAPTNPLASRDTVEASEIREL